MKFGKLINIAETGNDLLLYSLKNPDKFLEEIGKLKRVNYMLSSNSILPNATLNPGSNVKYVEIPNGYQPTACILIYPFRQGFSVSPEQRQFFYLYLFEPNNFYIFVSRNYEKSFRISLFSAGVEMTPLGPIGLSFLPSNKIVWDYSIRNYLIGNYNFFAYPIFELRLEQITNQVYLRATWLEGSRLYLDYFNNTSNTNTINYTQFSIIYYEI
ncbi:MAG: hypothetical protein RMJ13_08000 [Elusimicrobiota bacterium]|nr:hypothetical protein [Elusimicrobiota bacterium]